MNQYQVDVMWRGELTYSRRDKVFDNIKDAMKYARMLKDTLDGLKECRIVDANTGNVVVKSYNL